MLDRADSALSIHANGDQIDAPLLWRVWTGLKICLRGSDQLLLLPVCYGLLGCAEGVTHQTLSAHRSEQFGQDYGVLLKEWRLLQRAVFVIDNNGWLVHAEYVADQMQEPDYSAAIAAACQAASE